MSAPISSQINCTICGNPVELGAGTDTPARTVEPSMSGAIWIVSWVLGMIPATHTIPNSYKVKLEDLCTSTGCGLFESACCSRDPFSGGLIHFF